MRRRGDKKATVAIAHKILTSVWWILTTEQPYQDPGSDVVTKATAEATRRRAMSQLEALGYQVTIEPAA